MAGRKRKRHHKKARHLSGEFMGGKRGYHTGKKKNRYYKRYYGADKVSPANTLLKGAIGLGGGVALSMAAKYMPIKNAKLQAAVPVAVGALLAMLPFSRRNPTLQMAGLGGVIVGGLSLIREFAPTVPLLTGDTYMGTDMYIPQMGEATAMLGAPMDGDMEGDFQGEFEGESVY